MARKKKEKIIEGVVLEDKSILQEYVLDKTDFDESAMEAIDNVEKFLREKQGNLTFVWEKFRYASIALLGLGGVVGIIIGYVISKAV